MLIKESNKAKIISMIEEKEGRARERKIDFKDLLWAIKEVEKKLNIPKKYMDGIRVNVDVNAQDFPKAYKYTADSTHFIMVKKASGWDLVNVFRSATRTPGRRFEVELTEVAKTEIIHSFSAFDI